MNVCIETNNQIKNLTTAARTNEYEITPNKAFNNQNSLNQSRSEMQVGFIVLVDFGIGLQPAILFNKLDFSNQGSTLSFILVLSSERLYSQASQRSREAMTQDNCK